MAKLVKPVKGDLNVEANMKKIDLAIRRYLPGMEYALVLCTDPTLKDVGVMGSLPPLQLLLMLKSSVDEVGRDGMDKLVGGLVQ